jgi:glutamate formiminotransferase
MSKVNEKLKEMKTRCLVDRDIPALIEALEVLIEANAFYADRKNSCGSDTVPVYIYEKAAGSKARQALAKVEELLNAKN